MTRKLYWESNAIEAHVMVLACDLEAGGQYALRLDQTPFHPQGGGQPSDSGWIGNTQIKNAVSLGEEIIHYADRYVGLGRTLARVDPQKRYCHSRLHSAGHLVAHALETQHWTPIKAHHWPGEARIHFSPPDSTSRIDTNEVQQLCDALIAQDLSCESRLIGDQFREVRFGHLPPYACGGTHVESTGELKGLKILSSVLKKGRLVVSYEI